MMKRLMYMFVLMFSLSTAFVGCREEKGPGEKIEEAADDVGDGIENAADDVEDALD